MFPRFAPKTVPGRHYLLSSAAARLLRRQMPSTSASYKYVDDVFWSHIKGERWLPLPMHMVPRCSIDVKLCAQVTPAPLPQHGRTE
jgi:hypothetical protein